MLKDSRRQKSLQKWGRDLLYPSYPKLPSELRGPLPGHVSIPEADPAGVDAQAAIGLGDRILSHRFELLGSRTRSWNWRDSPTGATRSLQINQPNRVESSRIRTLLDPEYDPIDWHGVPGTPFRWSESLWFKEIRIPYDSGVDIKLPWELARFQHGHSLLLCYRLSGDPVYGREFENQVLDFVSSNPPRFGLHWRSTMEVAIRAANWTVVFDHFRRRDFPFRPAFEEELKRSLYAHGLHILENLEWTAGKRNNHYLANIAGLLFIAAYLPAVAVTDAWLAFAIQELMGEIKHQFNLDGSFVEPTTGYHWLATELMVRCLNLVQGLVPRKVAGLIDYDSTLVESRPRLDPAPNPRFRMDGDRVVIPQRCIDSLVKSCRLCLNVRNPDGTVPRIGDWDGGRFLPLQPTPLLPEKVTHATAVVDGLKLAGQPLDPRATESHRHLHNSETPAAKQQDDFLMSYSDWGLHVFTHGPLRLLVRCGDLPALYRSGHTHCDQLSLLLAVHGVPFLIDPGNGSYTSDRALRDYFRSTRMHNTLSVADREQHSWCSSSDGAFRLQRTGRGRVQLAEPDRFEATLEDAPYAHRRHIRFRLPRIEIQDTVSPRLVSQSSIHLHLHPHCRIQQLSRRRVLIGRNGCWVEADSGDGRMEVREAVVAEDYARLAPAREIVIRPGAPITHWSLTLSDGPNRSTDRP